MSTTPRPWVDDPENPTVTGANGRIVFWDSDLQNRGDRPMIVRAVNAFDALLAYVRAVEKVESEHACLTSDRPGELHCCEVCTKINAATKALDTAAPGWREW